MKALVLDSEHRTASVQDVPQPVLSPNGILVRVHSIALNPVDALYVTHPLGQTGRIVGSDFAGTVVSLGQHVPNDCDLRPGIRVAGFLQGACSINPLPGAFAEYLTCPWDLVFVIPETLSFDEAATMSLCALTAAQAIYNRLGFPAPWTSNSDGVSDSHDGEEDHHGFLIYGASTSVGLYAAQLVKRSAEAAKKSITLLGTASQNRIPALQTEPYNYDVLVDYRDQDWHKRLAEKTSECEIHYGFDCISEGNTVAKVSQILDDAGKLDVVRSKEGGAWDAEHVPDNITPKYGAVWEGLGEEVHYQGIHIPKAPESRAFTVKFYRWLSTVGKLAPNPIRLMPGGLERVVEDGFALLAPTMEQRARVKDRPEPWMRPVSAEKLVYRVGDQD